LDLTKISFINSEKSSRLLFCGDSFLKARDKAKPFTQILHKFEDFLVSINLETSLESSVKKKKNVSLSVTEKSLEGLPESVAFVNIVNNHSADAGDPDRLAEILRKRGKQVIGPFNPTVLRVCINRQLLDFVGGYLPLPRGASYGGTIANRLEGLLRLSDAEHRIVNLHWGYEHTEVPAPFQRDLAHRLIDAGANIIIGHHPHVAQGWEIYRGAPIFYSLGNFNFWQFDIETTEKNRWGYMVAYDIINAKAEPIPYRINENYQPVPVDRKDKNNLIKRIDLLSKKLSAVHSSDWLAIYYKQWYKRELKMWLKRCRKTKSPELLLKFIVWLILPMQLWYYAHIFFSKKKLNNGFYIETKNL